jgi:L-seryl-tRNA(Ser) seleniumtransferase
MKRELLRGLPKIDELLRRDEVRRAGAGVAEESLAGVVREAVADLRRGVLSGRLSASQLEERIDNLPDELRARIAGICRSTLRPVINATGIIVHTNLGRAPLPPGALERVLSSAGGYVALEYDLTRGERGSRGDHLQRVADRLFPARSIHAVNNNAAALLLVLNTLAQGREVLISRGELIEIGGSFRIPEIMARSGAILREVGTTNRTRRADFEKALGPRTGLILKVHTSNYRIVGFTAEAGLEELVDLGRSRGVPVAVDQGSGALVDLSAHGIPDEPTVGEILEAGADAVMFSGDKVLGGPQAGIIVGDPEIVTRCRKNHLSRALRLDKMAIAALEWTLQRYAAGRERSEIPVLRMLTESEASLARRAQRLATDIQRETGQRYDPQVVEGTSKVGGGAAPLTEIPSRVVSLSPRDMPPGELDERLRLGEPPVVARVRDDRVWLDPRTVLPGQEKDLVRALRVIASESGESGEIAGGGKR